VFFMDSIYLLIPLSILLLLLIVAALFWAIKSGQFDDLDRMGYEILFDEDNVEKKVLKNKEKKTKSIEQESNEREQTADSD
jgi:cbb3-type cytochrome oxidase maturation protein